MAVAVLTSLAAHNADAQSWKYQSYYNGRPSAPGYITLDEKDGKAVFRMVAGYLSTCYQGDLDATVTKTESDTIITVAPRLHGCDDTRFVIKNDGTGGRRETKKSSKWVWDGFERGLTLKK